jgi:CHASE1-domain containing sensor protein
MYTKLHQLCDVLEGKVNSFTQANPHELRIEESNELITGLKKLFNESSAAEQVRLMTIAPKTWGRRKTERWYVDCTRPIYVSNRETNFLYFLLLGFNQRSIRHVKQFSFETITMSSLFLNISVAIQQSQKKQ